MCLTFSWSHRHKKRRSSPSQRHKKRRSSPPSSISEDISPEKASTGFQLFSYVELQKATNNFDTVNELGNGGFGTVYRGKLLDGRLVAIKRLHNNNYRMLEQFLTEIEILARIRHMNLVCLYGSITLRGPELLLVYEYVPNGTVADHLHGHLARPGAVPWTTRMSIAVETASALAYLHASDIIHRDVKTTNILLGNDFTVKVADFGLSRFFPFDVSHVSTAPQGTPGYLDPQYHQYFHLSDKSDVYSFGVVLIELISSKPAVDFTRDSSEINLSNMAIIKIQNLKLHELVDPDLGYASDNEVRKMISLVAELAFRCLQPERDMRPSMQEVLNTLLEIQNKEKSISNNKMEEVTDIPPDSVMTNWGSKSTDPSTSRDLSLLTQ